MANRPIEQQENKTSPAIIVRHLKKVYENGLLALQDLSFELHRGEILGLVGPNGAGKSTTLQCVLGLIQRTAGEVTIDGYPPESVQARSRLGYIPEVPLLYNDLTVEEHLRFVGMAHGIPEAQAKTRIEQLLDAFDMRNRREEPPVAFSKGMHQKVSIMCALVHEPAVLLVDEPFRGLDPESVWKLKEAFRVARNRNAAILLSTHMLDLAETLCDRYLILHRGAKLAEGTLNELRDGLSATEGAIPTLEQVFLTLTQRTSSSASRSTGG